MLMESRGQHLETAGDPSVDHDHDYDHDYDQIQFHAVLLDAIEQAVIATDVQGRIVAWNRYAQVLYGWSREEVLGQSFVELVVPTTPNMPTPEPDQMMDGSTSTRQWQMCHKDGSLLTVMLTASPVMVDGELVGLVKVAMDLTGEQHDETQNREPDAKFREAADHLPLGVWVHDEEGRGSFANQAYRSFFGLDDQTFKDGDWRDLLHPEDRSAYVEEFQAAVHNRVPFHRVVRARRSDGQWRSLECWAMPRSGFTGQYLGHMGTCVDVTERESTEQSIRNSELHTRQVLDNLLTFTSVLMPDGTLVMSSKGLLSVGGITPEQVIGRKFWDCQWWNHSPEVQRRIHDAVLQCRHGEVIRFDTEARMSHNAVMPVEFHISPLRDDQGQVTHLIPSWLDISERVATEVERDRVRQRISILQGLAADLASAALPSDVARLTTAVIRDAFDVDRCDLGIITGSTLNLVADSGGEPTWRSLPLDAPLPPAEVARTEIPIELHHVADAWSHESSEWAQYWDVTGITSLILVPLPERLGCIGVLFGRHRVLQESERELLDAIAHQTAAALERSRLHEAAEVARHLEVRARGRAELITEVLTEIERRPGAQRRAQHLLDLLVPRIADWAAIESPDHEPRLLATFDWETSGNPPSQQVFPMTVSASETTSVDFAPVSEMAVPIELGGGKVGILKLALLDRSKRPYGAEDLEFLYEIAQRAGLALSDAYLRDEEHRISLGLQQALLPDQIVQHPDLEIAARYRAAGELLEVGGDWYDTFSWPNGCVGVMVGDVVGHGLHAAAAMGRLRSAVAALAPLTDASPAALLEAMDQCARGPNGVNFVTACCAVIDPSTGELRYASAGHPPMLVVSPRGHITWLDQAQSPPMCELAVEKRPERSIRLEPGSLLVMYSDGLVERRRERMDHGLQRLATAASQPAEPDVDAICDRIAEEMTADSPAGDDVVIVCVRFAEATATRFHQLVPALAGELAPLRAELRHWLQRHGVTGIWQQRAVLSVGEACTNAVEHAYLGRSPGHIEIDARPEGPILTVKIRDHGSWRPTGKRPGPPGHGTSIMQIASTDFMRVTSPNGTAISLQLPFEVLDG
jgi:PAS domain S-box-containing protein